MDHIPPLNRIAAGPARVDKAGGSCSGRVMAALSHAAAVIGVTAADQCCVKAGCRTRGNHVKMPRQQAACSRAAKRCPSAHRLRHKGAVRPDHAYPVNMAGSTLTWPATNFTAAGGSSPACRGNLASCSKNFSASANTTPRVRQLPSVTSRLVTRTRAEGPHGCDNARRPIPAARTSRSRPLPWDRWDDASGHRRRTRWSHAG